MTDKEIKQREAQMAQLLVLQTRVIYQQTVITNGLYKTGEIRFCGRDGHFITEAELLKNEIDTMKLHIIHMQDIQEDLIPSEDEV